MLESLVSIIAIGSVHPKGSFLCRSAPYKGSEVFMHPIRPQNRHTQGDVGGRLLRAAVEDALRGRREPTL